MIHSDIFERFVEDAPVCVMVQALMENALSPTSRCPVRWRAELQYTRELLFSDIVSLMSLVVCGIRPSINSAYKKMAPVLGVTEEVYDQVDGVEDDHAPALVRHSASARPAIIDELGSRNELWLEDYRVKILDGNHLPGTEHRLKPSGSPAPGPCPATPWSCWTPNEC